MQKIACDNVMLNKIVQMLLAEIKSANAAVKQYSIESKEEFDAALIEQAKSMEAGTERLVYFYDDAPAVFKQGYGIAKLYRHESNEQGGKAFVCVDVYSADERYYLNVVQSDIDYTWSCTDMVRVLNSGDDVAAVSLVDKTYSQFPVKANYGAEPVKDISDETNLVVWQYAEVNGETELELRGLQIYSLRDVIGGSGGTVGMVREFEKDVNGTVCEYGGTNSKFYIITLADNSNTDTTVYTTVTIDYRSIVVRDDGKSTQFRFTYELFDGTSATIRILVWKNPNTSIKFQLSPETPSTVKIATICGYY